MKNLVYLVDDDSAVLQGLTGVLESSGFEVLGFDSAERFLGVVTPESSGCVVLDIRMPGMDGLQAQVEMQKRNIEMPVIFLTGHGDVPQSVKAMKAGAFDFLEKPVPAETLIAQVEAALRTDRLARKETREHQKAKARIEQLTPREKDVLARLLMGETNKQAAKYLGISPRTVEIHRKNILEKAGVSSLVELSNINHLAESG